MMSIRWIVLIAIAQNSGSKGNLACLDLVRLKYHPHTLTYITYIKLIYIYMCVCVSPLHLVPREIPFCVFIPLLPWVSGGWTDGQQERGGDLRGRRSGVAGTVAWMIMLVIQNRGLHRRNDVYRFEDQARFLSIVIIYFTIYTQNLTWWSQIDVIFFKDVATS